MPQRVYANNKIIAAENKRYVYIIIPSVSEADFMVNMTRNNDSVIAINILTALKDYPLQQQSA